MNIPNDEFIRELLPEFLESWLDDIDSKYDLYIEEKNSQDLYRLAHTLKGSCFQFGLDEIAHMGIELMQYAKDQDWQKASAMKDQIRGTFLKVQNMLNDGEI